MGRLRSLYAEMSAGSAMSPSPTESASRQEKSSLRLDLTTAVPLLHP